MKAIRLLLFLLAVTVIAPVTAQADAPWFDWCSNCTRLGKLCSEPPDYLDCRSCQVRSFFDLFGSYLMCKVSCIPCCQRYEPCIPDGPDTPFFEPAWPPRAGMRHPNGVGAVSIMRQVKVAPACSPGSGNEV